MDLSRLYIESVNHGSYVSELIALVGNWIPSQVRT